MERQPDDPLQAIHPTNQQSPTPPGSTPTSNSVPTLRFPRPQVNPHLANYVSNSSHDIRGVIKMAEHSVLADSAYEIINCTDSEGHSQDGRMSESTGSLEVSRPDDVQSLDGSENHYDTDTDDDSEESDHSHASSIRYADRSLQSPSTHVSVNTLRHSNLTPEKTNDVPETIVFQQENFPNQGAWSAVHVVKEFTEEETTQLVNQLNLGIAPPRLTATLRQTMPSGCLVTNEPLRILYVGREEAKRSIVMKISSALWASSESDELRTLQPREGGLYNIVPISLFGPTPELDLMEASSCQIKVEHCTAAFGEHDGDGVYLHSISIGSDLQKTYTAVFRRDGTCQLPKGPLPHTAVFYRPDDEGTSEAETRRMAFEFTKACGIPALLISESQYVGKSLGELGYVDKHTPHLCVESRDPDVPIFPQRFPIDITSFTKIDARQMNRNLAYLTGLDSSAAEPTESAVARRSGSNWRWMKKIWSQRPNREQIVQSIEDNKWFLAVAIPILMVIMAPFITAIFTNGQTGMLPPSTHQTTLAHIPGRSPVSTTTKSIPTSTSTVVINVTSTKTIIVQNLPSTSSVASVLSYAGLLSDKPSAAPVEPEMKKTLCTVRVYSANELLVTVPAGSKTVWLAKGAIDIDVYRGGVPIKTKLSSVDEGILVELKQKDAYGALNVSVVTSRRPKINETFEVDFGTTVLTEALEVGMHLLKDISKMVSTVADNVASSIEATKLKGEASSVWSQTFQAMEAGRKQAAETAWKSHLRIEKAREMVHHQMQAAKQFRKEADLTILRAQVASKIWWLKIQGKQAESDEYEHNAALFIKTKYAKPLHGKATSAHDFAKESRSPYQRFMRKCRRRDVNQTEGKDRLWKKKILG